VDNSGRGQISAPGSLEAGATIAPDAPKVPDQDLGQLAAQHGLKLSGARPSLLQYLATLWQRRHFIVGYATARNVSMYTDAKLGQLWQVLTPLLNAGVYYLIFGKLFQASRGVDHYPAFLMVGVFVFAFTERSIVTGSNVMRANIQLIRALYFPRASLPLAYVIVELQQMLVGVVVLVAVMLASHQYPSPYWLLIIPAVLLQTLFNTGAALIVARLGGSLADVSELVPFFLRITRYFCGVMYMILTLPAALTTWEKQVLSLNPPAIFISLVRMAFMSSVRANSAGNKPFNNTACNMFLPARIVNGVSTGGSPGAHLTAAQVTQLAHQGITTLDGNPIHVGMVNNALQAYCHAIVTNNDLWIGGVAWGVVIFAVGIVFFWQAESLYGRG
jgi:teichoic acid transport system permease protein